VTERITEAWNAADRIAKDDTIDLATRLAMLKTLERHLMQLHHELIRQAIGSPQLAPPAADDVS
jgi:hypothetical protein